jgi:hypothetical protein
MDNEIIKAVIKKDVILCGKCLHKIAETKGLKHGLGNGTVFIQCSHRSSGKRCKCVNQIDL